MPKIGFRDFKGMVPRRHPRLLPEGMAVVSHNVRLESGALAPFRASVTSATLAGGPFVSIYRHQDTWLAWATPVNASPGPVAQDRLYYTGDGAPKMRVGGVVYPLALPPPNTAPTIEAQDAFEPPEIRPADDPIQGWDTQTPVPSPAAAQIASWRWDPTGIIIPSFTNLAWRWNSSPSGLAAPPGSAPPHPPNENRPPPATNLGVWEWEVVEGQQRWKLMAVPDEGAGLPHSLVVIRQPIGGLANGQFAVQPAVAVLDVNGDLVSTTIEVSVAVKTGFAGVVSGTRKVAAIGGIVRFADLVMNGQPEETYTLEFTSGDLEPVESEDVTVIRDPRSLNTGTLFAYTYVTSFGEESPPSPLSVEVEVNPSNPVLVSGFVIPSPNNRAINKLRVYRSITSASGVTDLYFAGEIPITQETFLHVLSDDPLAEVLPSADYDPPPAGLKGLTAMANGMMAAFVGKEVMFCEPFKPHAWPTKYSLVVDHEIVGLAAFGTNLAIITTGTPYVAQGFGPGEMVMEKIEQSLPCVSARSIVDMGTAAAYASHDGLVVIGPGVANVVTAAIFTRDQWRALNPEGFIAENYARRYVFSYQEDGSDTRKIGMFDLSGQEHPYFFTATGQPEAFYTNPELGKLFFLEGGNIIREFDAETGAAQTYTWISRIAASAALVNFGAMLTDADATMGDGGASCEVKIVADKVERFTTTIFGTPHRLPSGYLAQEWQIEVRANIQITEIHIAGDFSELMGGS
jgi:hypothetical protein